MYVFSCFNSAISKISDFNHSGPFVRLDHWYRFPSGAAPNPLKTLLGVNSERVGVKFECIPYDSITLESGEHIVVRDRNVWTLLDETYFNVRRDEESEQSFEDREE